MVLGMTDSAVLARELAELDKVATPGPWSELEHSWQETRLYAGHRRLAGFSTSEESEEDEYQSTHETSLIVALRNNLPAILRALCVQAAVEEGYEGPGEIHARADELLAELTGAK